MRERDQEELLAELIRFQEELPASWKENAAWDLPEPERPPIPDEFTKATIDMRAVLASWRTAESP